MCHYLTYSNLTYTFDLQHRLFLITVQSRNKNNVNILLIKYAPCGFRVKILKVTLSAFFPSSKKIVSFIIFFSYDSRFVLIFIVILEKDYEKDKTVQRGIGWRIKYITRYHNSDKVITAIYTVQVIIHINITNSISRTICLLCFFMRNESEYNCNYI